MHELYSVEELAKTGDTTPRAVRLYVERGLLTPLRAGRALCFTPADVVHLQNILRTKRLGFSLAEIHCFQADPNRTTVDDRIRRVRQIRTDADQELAALDRLKKARR